MSADDSSLPKAIADGLMQCDWPGRCQVVVRRNITFHIDGAHTADSLKLCVDWFNERTKSGHRKKLLIFNSTGERDSHQMLNIIHENVDTFDEALFSPNISSPSNRVVADSTYTTGESDLTLDNVQHWTQLSAANKAQAFTCVADVLQYLESTYGDAEVVVLVTGSLHLVGAVLRTISDCWQTKKLLIIVKQNMGGGNFRIKKVARVSWGGLLLIFMINSRNKDEYYCNLLIN